MSPMKKLRVVILRKKAIYTGLIVLMVVSSILIFNLKFLRNLWSETFVDPNNGIIVIDPGHGGIDGGTTWGGLLEKDINLDVALKLRECLEDKGYTVVMTRELDVSLESLSEVGQSRYIRDLNARVNIINSSNAQLFLSIHVNCHIKNPKAGGAIIFYNNNYTQNEILAYSIQRKLNNMVVHGKNRTTHDPRIGNYFLLKNSNIPGIIIEMAFISNESERKLLTQDEFKEQIAQSILEGVDKYFMDKILS